MEAFVLNLFLLIGFQEKKTCFNFRGLPLLKTVEAYLGLPGREAFNRFEFNRVSLVGVVVK